MKNLTLKNKTHQNLTKILAFMDIMAHPQILLTVLIHQVVVVIQVVANRPQKFKG